MSSVNKVILVGNLGADPEIRRLNNGDPVVNLRIATSESWRDKNSGDRRERTEWHRVVVWGKSAEHCNNYLSKGRQVYVEGRIQTRKYTDKEGVERYSTEVVADTVQFLGSRQGGQEHKPNGSNGSNATNGPPQMPMILVDPSDDDIPF